MNLPRISIIVPSFNQGQFIGETLESLLLQNYPALEIIVMDGGSTDESVNVIRSFEKQITYWESSKDRGQSHAINKGLSRATGEIFNWLNSDDLLEKGALMDIGKLAAASPRAELFAGRTRIFEGDKTVQLSGRIVFQDTESTIGYAQMNQPAMYFRTRVLERTGMLNETLHMCMDLDLWLRFLLVFGTGAIVTSENTWAHFRHHSGSKSISSQESFDREKKIIFRNLYESLGVSVPEELIPKTSVQIVYPQNEKIDPRKCFNYHLLWQADAFSLMGDPVTAKKYFRHTRFRLLNRPSMRRYLAVAKRLYL